MACGCGVKFPTYPAKKSHSILLHNLDTVQLWTEILVQETKMNPGLILFKARVNLCCHLLLILLLPQVANIVFSSDVLATLHQYKTQWLQ